MEKFIHDANIERYRRLLAGPLDEQSRRVVSNLLTEEQAQEAQLGIAGTTLQLPASDKR